MSQSTFYPGSFLLWSADRPNLSMSEAASVWVTWMNETRIGLRYLKRLHAFEDEARCYWKRGECPPANADAMGLSTLGQQPPLAWMPTSIPPPADYYEDWARLTPEQRHERAPGYFAAFDAAMELPPDKEWLRAPLEHETQLAEAS